jgi:GMP synthase (glutamine-hydrolysing)
MILYLKHIAIEGPETLGDFIAQTGMETKTIELWRGDPLPKDFSGLKAVVSLGGPMNVDEETRHPFLIKENEFIKEIVKRNIPYLGICLGSQLLAKAAGAKVYKAKNKEIGLFEVTLTAEGKRDPLFEGLENPLLVFQWHEDTFDLPEGATLLASSAVCPHQAFRLGSCAYGVQFHVEITEKNIREWSADYLNSTDKAEQTLFQTMISDYKAREENYLLTAQKIYNNFLKILNSCRL